jgi:DDE domain
LSSGYRPSLPLRSAFTGFRLPADVIVLAVRWYLRYGLSNRDVEELLSERGVEVENVTVYRSVQRLAPLLDVRVSTRQEADSARRFFKRELSTLKATPSQVTTDAARLTQLRRGHRVRAGGFAGAAVAMSELVVGDLFCECLWVVEHDVVTSVRDGHNPYTGGLEFRSLR